jgi:hypothetical protein
MPGFALGRPWDSHPKIAFVAHLIITVMLGGFALLFNRSGSSAVAALISTIGFLVMGAVLAFSPGSR